MSAIDPEIAGQLAAVLPRDEFLEILRTFEADLARLVAEFETAAASPDPAGLRRAAHSLAGTAAGIGARRLEAASRLAMEPRIAEPPDALLRRVRSEAETTFAELAALMEKVPG